MAGKPKESYWINEIQWAFCVTCECDTARYKPPKGKKIGECKACIAKRHATPENKARQAELRALPENKAKRAAYMVEYVARPEAGVRLAARHARAKAERAAYRNFLLLSMGVTDLTQDYDFHHVVGRKVTGHKAIGSLLVKGHNFWEQVWEEAHELCVVMTKADHERYHSEYKMQEDGTFAVRSLPATPIT